MAQIEWATGVSGNFDNATDWTGGVVPGNSDEADLAVAGTYTVTIPSDESQSVGSLTVDSAGVTFDEFGALSVSSTLALAAGTIVVEGTLNNGGMIDVSGGTFWSEGTITNNGTINPEAGTFYAGGTIVGGTIISASPAFIGNGATLVGVTFDGPLNVGHGLSIRNGLTVTGANGTGPGVIDLGAVRLSLEGSKTLQNGVLNIGGQLELYSNGNPAANLTLDANFDVVQAGKSANIGTDGENASIVNRGSITAGVADGAFQIDGPTVVNQGMIAASGAGATFSVYGKVIANDGTITITNGDTLELVGQVGQSPSGVISVAAGSSMLMGFFVEGVFQRVTQIDGGTVESSGSGELLVGGRLSTLGGTNAATTDEATFAVPDDAVLNLVGAIANTGVIAVTAGADITGLSISTDGATLSGAGLVTLTGVHARIIGASAAAVLTNGNTISGVGEVGQGRLTLINTAAGVIDGVGATAMVLDTAGETLVNDGLIEDTGGAGLAIRDTTVNGAGGGTITSAGGPIRLQGADLVGGKLTGGPVIAGSGTNVLDGTASAVDNEAHVQIVNGQGLTIEGAITNTGEIALESGGATTTLTVGAAGVTLTGGGQVFMDNETENLIVGASSAATLTNAGNVILGAGDIGDGKMALGNEAGSVIEAERADALTIDTGANAIVNAGLIEVTGTGGATIASAVDNTGVLKANVGSLSVEGAVSGTGRASIGNGTLSFASSFSQNVAFTGKSGELELAQSQAYAGTISGFSQTGATSLDLEDIAYVSGSTTATYVGTTAGGVLTVISGSEVATIAFTGNYTKSTWTLSAAPGGGTLVVDPAARVTGRMIQAIAGLPTRAASERSGPAGEPAERRGLLAPPAV